MPNPKTITPVRPSAAIRAAYQARLDKLIAEMSASVTYWLTAGYRANEPEILAMDESPARALQRAVRKLARRWQRKFDELAPELAAYFAASVEERSTSAMRRRLRDAGFTVRFRMTPALNDVMQATTLENVSLIKSIPSEYFTQVQGLVMRSVTVGRDLADLTDELEARYGVTRRRAELIARDQNNKATATVTRVRQQEAGITEAIWMHSAGGKTPRPSHVAFNGKKFNVRDGALIDGERIWPGELINCRCVSRSVVPGFS